jgi:UPF0755 protein
MKLLLPVAVALSLAIVTAAAVWMITESPNDLDDIVEYSGVPAPSGEAVLVSVEGGDSPQEIGARLEEMGVIESTTQFRVLVSFLGYDGMLQAGEYEFQPGTPALDAVYRLRKGVVSTRSVTVIEGWRLEEVADAFAAEGITREDFLAAARAREYDFDFLKRLKLGQTVEGYLHPAVYSVRRNDTAADIIQRLLQAFADNVPADVLEEGNGGLTLHEVVALASIIEREAQVPSERPIMAQVFLSRLAQGIPLEADPTVQYAVAENPRSIDAYGYWKANLTRADLQADSPYNTYQNAGLPPGPICNPGLDSILAVINPAETDFLYFVAKADGSHLFAETFDEHLENIAEVEGR